MYKQGGFKRFWRGGLAVTLGCIPTHAVYFSIYEISKTKFNVHDDKITPISSGLVGITSTFFHDLILNPFDGFYLNSWLIFIVLK